MQINFLIMTDVRVPNGIDTSNGVQPTPGSVRLPPFIESDPELWFALVDRLFAAQPSMDDAAKFTNTIVALGPRHIGEVRDLCMSTEREQDYADLKAQILKRFGESQTARTKRLLEREEIGDRRPSQFLRHLRSLAGAAVPDATLRTLWLGRLPQQMQNILVVQHEATLDRLAELADIIAENISSHTSPPAAVMTTNMTPASDLCDQITQLQSTQQALLGQLKEMQMEMAAMQRRRPRSRSRSSTRPRTPARSSTQCWYHAKFASKAHKCILPCSYANDTKTGNEQAIH